MLNNKNQIREIVNRMLDDTGMSTMTLIDLNKFLRLENIKLFKLSSEEWNKKFSKQKALAILLKTEKDKIIILNEHALKEDETFTIAHEIGHLFLHTDKDKPQILCRHGEVEDKEQEDEADYFAACLLMPEKAVLDLVKKFEIPSVSKFADIFGVTSETARRRFVELNITCTE